jgi:sirohydrochlorin ferrochelatase
MWAPSASRGAPIALPPTLLAVAHGSRDLRSPASIRELVSAIASERPDLRTEVAFLELSDPLLPTVLDDLVAAGDHEPVVVPLLLTTAYHSGTDLPGVLAAARRKHPQLRPHVAEVLGPDPLLLAALERRLREIDVWPGDPNVAVVLATAGSSDPAAKGTIEALALNWATAGWWAVEPAYASASEPTVAEAIASLRTRGAPRIVVAPYFLAPGQLLDRVVAAAEAADAYAAPLGAAPELARLVLTRYDEALAPSGRPPRSHSSRVSAYSTSPYSSPSMRSGHSP